MWYFVLFGVFALESVNSNNTIVTSAESMLVLDYVLHSTTKNLLSLVYSLSDLVSIHPPEG